MSQRNGVLSPRPLVIMYLFQISDSTMYRIVEFQENLNLSEKRNKIASITAGFFFFSGWWFAIDASASYYMDTRDIFHLCGVFSTISMFMVNAVSNSLLRGEGYTDGFLGPVGARIWFFFGFMMGFGSLIGELLKRSE